MATTVRDIVTRALHMSRIVARGEDPDADELRDGVTGLQSLYSQWLIGGMFGTLADVYSADSYEAGEGQRIFLDSGTVTLPDFIDNDRKPRDLVAIETNDPTNGRQAFIWDRTAWVRIDSLTENDDAPLADRGVNGLAACLAMVYADEFGQEIGQAVVRQASAFKTALALRLGSETDPVAGQYY